MSEAGQRRAVGWLKRFGLYGVATSLVRLRGQLRFRFADDVGEFTVGGTTAEFYTTTPNEFFAVRDYPEVDVIADILSSLRPDDVFYDIGANIGVFSCFVASNVEPDVIAFEPEPKNAARLRENARLNHASIVVHEVALSDANETQELGITHFDGVHQTGPAGHSFVENGDAVDDIISIESVIGDEYIEEHELPIPTVVKIDVEGAEGAVLSGLESTLSHPDCRTVYCEVHEDRLHAQGRSVADIKDKLTSMGFAIDIPFDPYGEPFLRGRKSGAETSS